MGRLCVNIRVILLAAAAGVAPAQQMTIATSPASQSNYGDPVTIIALFNTGTSPCAGATVSYFSDNNHLGDTTAFPLTTYPFDAANTCEALFMLDNLGGGSHTLSIRSSGFSNQSTPFLVNKAVPSLNVQPGPRTIVYGQLAGATVTPVAICGDCSIPTGSIGLLDGLNKFSAVFISVPLMSGQAVQVMYAIPAGGHALGLSYSGDNNYFPIDAEGLENVQVSHMPTTLNLLVSAASSTIGQGVTLTATIVPAMAGAPIPPASSSPVVFYDGQTSLGSALPNGVTASFNISTLQLGIHSLTAAYSGDDNYLGSSSSAASLTVNQIATTTSLQASPPSPAAGQSVTLTATVSPSTASGTVTFLDGSATLGTAPLNAGTASLSTSALAAGSHSLTVSYNGDTNDAPSTSQGVSLSVAAGGARAITSLIPSTAAAGGAAFTLTVNGTGFSPGSVVQWNGAAVATNSIGDTQVTATILANLIASPGTAIVTVANTGGTTPGVPFVVNPSGQPCSFTLKTSSAAFASGGGSGSIAVTASRSDCLWTGSTSAPWISGFNQVTGSGTLNYTVGANAGATSRIGIIAIGSQNFSVIQAGTTCIYSLPFASQTFTAAGGTGSAAVRAPPGCAWTATSNAPGVTIAPPGTGSGDGTATFTVAPNPSAATLNGMLTIAGHPFTVVESGSAVNQKCTASVPSVPQVALEGRTEALGDLLVSCTGLSGSLKADVTLTLNTNVTNTLTGTGNATDAVMTVNGGASQSGLIGGYNSLRWFGVPVSPAGDGSAVLRISKVRADASLLANPGNLQPVSITGQVNVSFLAQGVSLFSQTLTPVAGASQTMANAAPTLVFTRGQANPPSGGPQTLIPIVYQEASAAAFQAHASRLHVSLSNLPATLQLFAPVYPSEGTSRAQLYSADASGAGGSPVSGSPMAGATYQALTVAGGKATATWLVLAADPAQVETWTFPLLVINASAGDLSQIQLSASLAPVSDVSVASATAPTPRYRDFLQFQLFPQPPVVIRIESSLSCAAGSCSAGGNVSDSIKVTNDGTDPSQTATGVKVDGNVSSGQMVTGCQTSAGASCSQSGQQFIINCGTLLAGQTCSATITTQTDPALAGGSVLDNSVSVSGDQPVLDPSTATADSTIILVGGQPAAVAGTPAFGSGAGQTFTFQFSHPSGYQNLGVVNILINRVLDGRGACYLAYVVPISTLVLVNDGGDAGGPYAGSVVLGSASAIQNSQCTVTLVSASGSGTTLTLVLSVAFTASFGGNRILFVAARDQAQGNSDWQPLGVWQAPFTPPGTIAVTNLTPGRGVGSSGTAQQLALTLTDTKGAGDFGIVDVLINRFIDGRQACYLAYVASTNTLVLIDDAGEAGGPYAGSMPLNGGSGSIQNGQCMVTGAGSSVTPGANSLKLTLNITFKAAFVGNQVVYAAGRDSAGGNNTDWQAVGTFTVH